MTDENIPTESGPNVSPMSPAPSFYGETSAPKPKSKNIKIIVGVLIGLIFVFAVGVTVALWTRVWDPLWNPFRPEPEKVIQEMTERMKKVKTMHSALNFELDTKEGKQSFNVSLKTNSDEDKSDSKNLKASGNFDLAFSAESQQFSVGGETKSIGEVSYFEITKIPAALTDLVKTAGIDLDQVIKNKWIKIDSESINNFLREALGSNLLQFGISINDTLNNSTESQKEMQKKFEKMIEGEEFFIVKSELPDTTINGLKTYHYVLTLSKAEIKNIIPDFAIIYVDMIKQRTPPGHQLTEKDIAGAKKGITDGLNKAFDEFFAKVGDIESEVWIGKKDYLLYGVKMEKAIDLSKIDKYSKGTITFKIDMNFSNFDKPLAIEAPKNSTDVIEILLPIIQTSLEQAREKAKDGRIMTDLAMARTEAEIIYNKFNSYENLCTKSSKRLNRSGQAYGTELGQIEDNIKSAQGGTLNLLCFDSATSYCITARLASGGMYCVDSSSYAREIQKNKTCIGIGTLQYPYKCPPPIMP